MISRGPFLGEVFKVEVELAAQAVAIRIAPCRG